MIKDNSGFGKIGHVRLDDFRIIGLMTSVSLTSDNDTVRKVIIDRRMLTEDWMLRTQCKHFMIKPQVYPLGEKVEAK